MPGAYPIGEQQSLWRECAYSLSRQCLLGSHTQSAVVIKGSDTIIDPYRRRLCQYKRLNEACVHYKSTEILCASPYLPHLRNTALQYRTQQRIPHDCNHNILDHVLLCLETLQDKR